MNQEYSAHPALPSTISRFWKYVLCLQSFSFIITVTFQADATRCPGQSGDGDVEHSLAFFAGMEADVDVRNPYFHCLTLI
jgi:hypothetical protein